MNLTAAKRREYGRMKFTVCMKDPDKLTDAIRDAVSEQLAATPNIDDAEREALVDGRVEKISDECCRRWFAYGEYLEVEIDTDDWTCIVPPRQ